MACLASFRALFTNDTASQRLPPYHEDHRTDPERRALAKFSFHNIGRSSTSIPPARLPGLETPFDPSLTKSKAFTKIGKGQQYNQASEEGIFKMLSRPSGDRSGSGTCQIHVMNDIDIYEEDNSMNPEAAQHVL